MDKMIVGMDVAKEWIEVAIAGRNAVVRIAKRDDAIVAWLDAVGVERITLAAFEPTGGFERTLRRCRRRAGVAFARVQVVTFRRRRGIRAKTDRPDARLLADFAADELIRRGLAPRPTRSCVSSSPAGARFKQRCMPSAAAATWPSTRELDHHHCGPRTGAGRPRGGNRRPHRGAPGAC